MLKKSLNSFGNNEKKYFLPLIKNTKGREIRTSLLTEEERYQLLGNPPTSDVIYAVKALLYRTELEFQAANHHYDTVTRKDLAAVRFHASLETRIKTIDGYDYYQINLDQLTSGKFPKTGWIKCVYNSIVVAKVLLIQGKVAVYSDQPISIIGNTSLVSLKIWCQNRVYLEKNITVEKDCIVYSDVLVIDDSVKEIQARHCIFYLSTECKLNGHIRVETLQVKTPSLEQNGFIEARREVQIVTHTGDQKGDIFAGELLIKVAHRWDTSTPDGSFATVHSPGKIQILCCYYNNDGCISTNQLILQSYESQLTGNIYSGEITSIHADYYLNSSRQAQFYFNGAVFLNSNFISIFAGNIFYSPQMSISWKSISHSSTNKLAVDKTSIPKILKLHANAYMEISGGIYARGVDVEISASYKINLSGLIWHKGEYFSSEIKINSDDIAHQGELNTTGTVSLLVKKSIVQSGKIQAREVNLGTTSYRLESKGTLIADQLTIQVEKTVKTQRKSQLKSKTAYIASRDLFLFGSTYIDKAVFEIRRLTFLLGNHRISDLTCVTPIFMHIGHLSAKDRLSVTSYVSLIAGLVTSDLVNNTSLLNINLLSMTVQLSVKSPRTLTNLLTAVNLVASIANLTVPGIQAVTVPFQLITNSALQLYSTYRMIEQARTTATLKLQNSKSNSNVVRTIAIVSQLLMSISAILLSLRKNISTFEHLSSPRGLSIHEPQLIPLLKTTANSLGRLISGNNNSSLIDVGLLKFFMGASNNDSHLISANIGGMLGLTTSDVSMIALKGDLNATLSGSSQQSLEYFGAGNSLTPVGYSISNHDRMYLYSALAATHFSNRYWNTLTRYNNWSIQSGQITNLSNVTFNNSSINADLVRTDTRFHAVRSLIKSDIDNTGKFQAEGCAIYAPHFRTTDQVTLHGSFIKAQINNSGNFQATGCQIYADNFHTTNQVTIEGSLIKARIDNSGNFQAAGCQISADNFHTTNQVIINDSVIQGDIENSGTVILIRDQLDMTKIENQSHGAVQIGSSNGSVDTINNESESLFAIDASDLALHDFSIAEDAKVGVRSSKLNITSVVNKSDLDIYNSDCTIESLTGEGDNNKVTLTESWIYNQRTTSNISSRGSVITSHEDQQSHDVFVKNQVQFNVSYDGRIIYSTTGPLTFGDQDFYSILPIVFQAGQDIQIHGTFVSYCAIFLESDRQLTVSNAQIELADSSIFKGKTGTTYENSTVNSLGIFQSETDGRFVNAASIINADKGVNIYATQGVDSHATITVTVVVHKKWVWHGIHSGRKITKDITTTITPAIINSKDGVVYIESSEGDVNLTGTFVDGTKIGLIAKNGSVNVLDIKGVNVHIVDLYSFIGHSKNKVSTVAYMPSTLLGRDNITIQAKNNCIGQGVIIKTEAQFLVESKNVQFSRSILQTTAESNSIGLTFSAGPNSFFSDSLDPFAYMPLVKAAQNLMQANSALGRFAAGVSFGIAAVNQGSNVINDWAMGAATSKLGTDLLFSPNMLDQLFSVSVGISQQKSKMTFQTLGGGSIDAKEIVIHADNIEFDNAYEVKATEKCELVADTVTVKGATLHNTETFQSVGVSVQFSLLTMGFSGASVQMSESSFSQTQHVLATLNAPNLVINAKDLNIVSGQIQADKISGSVDRITITSEKDETQSKSTSISAGMSSSVSFSSQNSHDESLPEKSSLTAKDSSQFNVGEIDLTEATTNVSAHTINEQSFSYDHSVHGFGFTVNVNDFIPVGTPSFFPASAAPVLNTVDINVTNDSETINFQLPYLNTAGYQRLQDNIAQLRNPVIEQPTIVTSQANPEMFSSETDLDENIRKMGIHQSVAEQPRISGEFDLANVVLDTGVNGEYFAQEISQEQITPEPSATSSLTSPDLEENLSNQPNYSTKSVLIDTALPEYNWESISTFQDSDSQARTKNNRSSIWDALNPMGTAYADTLDNSQENYQNVSLTVPIPPEVVGPNAIPGTYPNSGDNYSFDQSQQQDWYTFYSSIDNTLFNARVALMLGESPIVIDDKPLYRGDTLHYTTAFEEGFKAKGSNTDMLAHAFSGDTNDSAYVSTSLSKDVALTFPRPLSLDIERSYLYEIHSERPVVKVSEALYPYFLQGRIDPADMETYIGEKERAFVSEIEPSEIKGSWIVDIEKITAIDPEDLWISNPTAEQINDFCYEYTRTPREEFIPNPNYIPPGYSAQQLWGVSRSLGHVMTGVSLVLDGASLYHEYEQSEKSGDFSNTYREAARIGGGWTGAMTTGALFAKLGAVGCAPLSPVASAACGVAGGFLGSFLGYYEGEKIGAGIYDQMKEKHLDATVDKGWDEVERLWQDYKTKTEFEKTITPQTPLFFKAKPFDESSKDNASVSTYQHRK